MKTKMRLLSIVMTIAMLVGMFPISSMAAGDYPTITVDTAVLVTLDGELETAAIYKFVPETDGSYIFYSFDADYDTYGHLYNGHMEEIIRNDDGGDDTNFRIIHDLTAGNEYYLKGRFFNTDRNGSFKMVITKAVPATSISITDDLENSVDSAELFEGRYQYFKTLFEPSNAAPEEVIWSTDSDAVHISGGSIDAIKPGTATITATSASGLTDSITLTVKEAPVIVPDSEFTVTHDNGYLGAPTFKFIPEKTGTYSVTTNIETNNTTDIWFSYPDGSGSLSFEYNLDYDIGNNGCRLDYEFEEGKTYYISVGHGSSETNSVAVKFTELVPATDMEIMPAYSGTYGTTVQLIPTFLPDNYIPEAYTYTSSADDIVSVDEFGFATLHKIGEAKITVTSENGHTAECVITVTDIPTITEEQSLDVDITDITAYALFKFTPERDGLYRFRSIGDYDTVGYILDTDQNVLADNDGSLNFSVNYDMTAGTTYILKAKMYSDSTLGSFSVTVEMIDNAENIIHDIESYTYDDDFHYGDCKNCGQSISQAHSYSSDDPTCYCGYTHEHSCSYAYDVQYHYGNCDGCGLPIEGEHIFDENGLCVCGFTDHEHVFTWYSPSDEYQHYTECAKCLLTLLYDHEFNEDGVCICGYTDHEHDYKIDTDDKPTDTSHSIRCSICELYAIEDHEFDKDGKCECGYTYHIHSGKEFYVYVDYHYGDCDICGNYYNDYHSYNEEGMCVCGAMDHEHLNTEYIDVDSDSHNLVCADCGMILSSITHYFGDNGICTDCGHVYGGYSGDGICIGDDVVLYDGQFLKADGTVTDTEPAEWVAHFEDMVLTLQDIDIESENSGILYYDGDIEIVIYGNVNITVKNDDGIYLEHGNLTISGTGTLTVTSLDDYDGIDAATNGDITIDGGVTVIIDAVDSGIEAEERFTLNDGTVIINVGDEGIDAEDAEVNGGILIINADNDGIDADDDITVDGGYILINAGSSGFETDGNITVNGGSIIINAEDEGILAGTDPTFECLLTINGGNINITSAEAALHTTVPFEIADAMGTVDMDCDEEGYYYSVEDGEILSVLVLPTDMVEGLNASLSDDIGYYTGKDITPTITVTDGDGNTLTEGTDYTAEWSSDEITEEGIYVVTITGTGDYEGLTVYKMFTVKNPVVYVGGVEMHNGDYLANGADTVTDKKPTGGYAYFNNGVVELNGYVYEGEGYLYMSSDEDYTAVIYSKDEVSIVLKGESILTNTVKESDCIVSDNDINVKGNGKLTLNGDYGFYCYGSTVAIDGGTINISVDNTAIYSESVAVNGGSITIDAGNGIHSYSFEMSGGTMKITADEVAIYTYIEIIVNGGIMNIEAEYGLCSNYLAVNGGYIKIDAERKAIEVINGYETSGIYFDEDVTIIDPENTEIKFINGSYNVFGDDGLLETSIVISDANYGDANCDGKITITDASVVLKYISKWDISINDYTADANGDGKVSLADVSLLLKYLAKWDVTLGK